MPSSCPFLPPPLPSYYHLPTTSWWADPDFHAPPFSLTFIGSCLDALLCLAHATYQAGLWEAQHGRTWAATYKKLLSQPPPGRGMAVYSFALIIITSNSWQLASNNNNSITCYEKLVYMYLMAGDDVSGDGGKYPMQRRCGQPCMPPPAARRRSIIENMAGEKHALPLSSPLKKKAKSGEKRKAKI